MADQSYFNSDEYQREIATGYATRIAAFPADEVARVLATLGFSNINPDSIVVATGGNIHATYLTPELVIKLNQDRAGSNYFANKYISDRLGDTAPIVQVLAYDNFEKTNFEALVMERTPGKVLQHDIFEMGETDLREVFRQVLEVVRQLSKITFDEFGEFFPANESELSFPTYGALLREGFLGHIATIRQKQLVAEPDIRRVEQFVVDRLSLFDNDRPVFVHTDLHMGNIMHDRSKLTAIIDFDHARKAPAMIELATLLSFLGDPQQFVEGRPEWIQYKGKSFLHLLPMLKGAVPELFEDPDLLKKLNLIYLTASIHLISENWSAKGNEVLMRDALENGLTDSATGLEQTFYGRTLKASS